MTETFRIGGISGALWCDVQLHQQNAFAIDAEVPFDSVYVGFFAEDETLLGEAMFDGGNIRLDLVPYAGETIVCVRCLKNPDDQCVAEFEGIVGDLRLADRIACQKVRDEIERAL